MGKETDHDNLSVGSSSIDNATYAARPRITPPN